MAAATSRKSLKRVCAAATRSKSEATSKPAATKNAVGADRKTTMTREYFGRTEWVEGVRHDGWGAGSRMN
jgi:hypothetical protein